MKLHLLGRAILLLTLVVALTSTGCVAPLLASRIVKAPNRQTFPRPSKDPQLRELRAETDKMYASSWRVAVGPPAAEVAVAVLDPGDYRLVLEVIESPSDPHRNVAFNFDWHHPTPAERTAAATRTPKGTLVILHGIMMNKESCLMWALYFAEKGYRVVLVDLRGHGRSTGEWMGYGAWEGADLVKVTDELQRRGLLQGKLGAFGVSYGAVVALHWAALDPRVAALVAISPFSEARPAIMEFARGISRKLTLGLSDATFASAEDQAAAMAGFRWSDTDVIAAVKRLHAPVLFFHGDEDTWIPPSHSEALAQVAPPGSRRVLLPKDNHISITFRFDSIGPQATAWWETYLGPTTPLPSPGAPPGP